jgi:RNA polymerase primary sigma factor
MKHNFRSNSAKLETVTFSVTLPKELANRLDEWLEEEAEALREETEALQVEADLFEIEPTRDGEIIQALNSWLNSSRRRRAVNRVMKKFLTPREELVLRMSYGIGEGVPHTLQEIATTFAVSRSRIGQIRQNAFRKLRHPDRREDFQAFLDSIDISPQTRRQIEGQPSAS